MGFNLEKARKMQEKRKNEFLPVALHEGNVQSMFNGRLASNEDTSVISSELKSEALGLYKEDTWALFSGELLCKAKSSIMYMVGQLKTVHDRSPVINVSDFYYKYDGTKWTENNGIMMEFLHLLNAAALITPFDTEGKYAVLNIPRCQPTLSPEDPGFSPWWESHKEHWKKETAEEESEPLCWIDGIAEEGDKAVQYLCGMMYANWKGVCIDKEKALYWLEKAAQQGYANAQYICGMMYNKGEGTAADNAKALYWYENAAQQGNAKAQFE